MLGLDAAGKTSEFLSCPMLAQDYYCGGLAIRESTWSICRWTEVRDGRAWKLSRFREGYAYLHQPPLSQSDHLPFLIFPRYED